MVPVTQELVLNPVITEMVERMLLPYCVRYQLNYDGIMHLMPGETPQDLHRDGFLYPFRHPAPPYTIACMWAQTEFTRENGGTCLIPGSHLWEQERKPRVEEVVQAAMPAGSVVIHTGGLYHGAGANRSNAPRTGISLQYNYAWLRQELNMYLTYPPEVARTFPDEVQRLIGYDFAAPYLGFVDGGSPQTLLKDTPPETREPRDPRSTLPSRGSRTSPSVTGSHESPLIEPSRPRPKDNIMTAYQPAYRMPEAISHLRQHDPRAFEHLEVRPLSGALGAEVTGVDLSAVDEDTFGDIRQAMLDHQVLTFPD